MKTYKKDIMKHYNIDNYVRYKKDVEKTIGEDN
jgi:hypothetical protein